jgi:hypothetical protein
MGKAAKKVRAIHTERPREEDETPLKARHRAQHHDPLIEGARQLLATAQAHADGRATHDDVSKRILAIIGIQEHHRTTHEGAISSDTPRRDPRLRA